MPKGTIAEKLMSMVDHIQNVHEFPQNKHFKRCSHGMPAPSRLKYIAKNSILLTKLRDIISGKNNSRINDANSLEECGQTGLNETLNSLHNMYAPKYLGLTHQTMIIKGTGLYNVQGKMERFQNKLGMGEKKVRIRVKKEVKGGGGGGDKEDIKTKDKH